VVVWEKKEELRLTEEDGQLQYIQLEEAETRLAEADIREVVEDGLLEYFVWWSWSAMVGYAASWSVMFWRNCVQFT